MEWRTRFFNRPQRLCAKAYENRHGDQVDGIYHAVSSKTIMVYLILAIDGRHAHDPIILTGVIHRHSADI